MIKSGNSRYLRSFGLGFLAFALTVLPCFSISAPSQSLLGLEEAIQIGLENNYSLSISRDQSELSRINRSGGQGRFLPSASADLTHSGRLGEGSPQTRVGASLNWLIFDGMQSYHAFQQLQSLEQSAILEERVFLEGLMESIMLAYYDIVQQNQKLNAIQALLAVSKERGELANAKLQIGAGSRLEQLQSLADLNQDSSTFLNQQVALRNAQIKLSQLLALDPTVIIQTTDTLPLEDSQPIEEWQKNLIPNNSSIAVTRAQRDASLFALKEARGRWLPNLNTGLAYSAAPEALNSGASASSGAIIYSANLSIPLFDKLATPTSVRRAKIELRQNSTRIKKTEAEIIAEFEIARSQYVSGRHQITLESRNLEVARLQSEGSRERYQLGVSSALEFRDAQIKLLDAEMRMITARLSAKQSVTKLQRLAGLLIRQAAAPTEGK